MTSAQAPPVSLIIAVYEQPRFLERVFASLLNQTLADFEVAVADDGSGPEVAEVIARHANAFRRPVQHVWHEDEGFRKTIIVNRAVTMTSADYLVFIDGDCILHHRFLERHCKRRRRARVLSGRRIMLDETLTEAITLDDVRAKRIEKLSFWWNNCPPHDRRHGIYSPHLFALRNLGRSNYQILGSNFSVHREDFYRVNGYDERIIGRGLEDNNLWRRFVNSGIDVVCIAQEALQYHCHHASKPIPHSQETVDEFRDTRATRTRYGITKE